MRSSLALSYDRAMPARVYDQDGRLHVDGCPVSKATVNPYRGCEVPGAEALGLDPDRIYQFLRPAEELDKAASTFSGIPLLSTHVQVSADEPQKQAVVGAVSNARFEAPYLVADLVVWDAEAIAAIEDGSQKELSSAYRYRALMEPGTFEGQRYDGQMVEIVANHVAAVPEGRAGPDVAFDGNTEPFLTRFPEANRLGFTY